MKHLGPILFLLVVLGGTLAWLWAYPQLLDYFKSNPRVMYDLALTLEGMKCTQFT